jgi:hypothetical protein
VVEDVRGALGGEPGERPLGQTVLQIHHNATLVHPFLIHVAGRIARAGHEIAKHASHASLHLEADVQQAMEWT